MNTIKLDAISVIQKIAMLSVLVALTGAQHCLAAVDPRDDDSASIFLVSEDIPDNPVFRAILENDITELQALLNAGQEANMVIDNCTPLESAVLRGRGRAVNILLENGANKTVNKVSGGNRTPLMTAALVGNPYIVRMLLKAKANPNIADDNGRTALMFAALNSHPDFSRQMVADLLSNEANPTMMDGEDETALSLAKMVHNKKVIEALGN